MSLQLVELIKQGAVAVEDIRITPTSSSSSSTPSKHPNLINNNSSGKTTPRNNTSQNIQLQQQIQQQQQQQFYYPTTSFSHSPVLKQIHVVVKNTPFGITLKSNDTQKLNFHNYVIKASLVYDCDPPKPVDFIHNEPLQYVATVNEEGDEVCVDVKVGILSSQHQGSLFIVILHITHSTSPYQPSNNEPIPVIVNHIQNNSIYSQNLMNICSFSHPIRIVSKVDHVKKEGIPILKKKTFHEILTDKLKKLQKSQEHQNKWIKNLYDQHGVNFDLNPYTSSLNGGGSKKESNSSHNSSSSSTPSFGGAHHHCSLVVVDNQSSVMDDNDDCGSDDSPNSQFSNDFDSSSSHQISNQHHHHPHHHQNSEVLFQNSFNRVVESYKLVPEDKKKSTVQQMVELLKSEDLEQLVKTFIDELHNNGAVGNNIELSNSSIQGVDDCQCDNCPAKKDLERFQGICMNFLIPTSSPSTSSTTTTTTLGAITSNTIDSNSILNSVILDHNQLQL
eukprot:gene3113-3893_t